MHLMRVNEKYYNLLKNGIKTIELRLNDEKRRQIKVGDKIEFINGSDKNDSFCAQVAALHFAPDFETLCTTLITPAQGGFETKEELLNVLQTFYTPAAQQKFGVVGIEIKRLS